MKNVRHLGFKRKYFFNLKFSTFGRVQATAVHHIFIFCRFSYRNAYSCSFVRFSGFDPLNGEQYQRDPNRHVLGRKKRHFMTYKPSKSVQRCDLWTRERNKKETPIETRCLANWQFIFQYFEHGDVNQPSRNTLPFPRSLSLSSPPFATFPIPHPFP